MYNADHKECECPIGYDGVVCEKVQRNQILGSYIGKMEHLTNTLYNYTVTLESDSTDITKIWIKGFPYYNSTIYATLAPNTSSNSSDHYLKFSIPYQVFNISGYVSGMVAETYEGITITSTIQPPSSTSTESCTFTTD